MSSRPAVTKKEVVSKKVGKDQFRTHRIGTACRTERSGEHPGQFLIWFPGYHYVKVDAVELLDYIQHTDNRPIL